MNTFEILKNLYTNRSSEWLKEVSPNDFEPLLLNKWLVLNPQNSVVCKYLDRFSFVINKSHWLHLCWSVVPKTSSAPFIKWVKRKDLSDEHVEVITKVCEVLGLKGRDREFYTEHFIRTFNKDREFYLKGLGMSKKVWDKYGLDYGVLQQGEVVQGKKGLDLWGF